MLWLKVGLQTAGEPLKPKDRGDKDGHQETLLFCIKFSPAHSNTKSSSLAADIFSYLGNSLQFTLAAFSPPVMWHRGASSDPERRVCCQADG